MAVGLTALAGIVIWKNGAVTVASIVLFVIGLLFLLAGVLAPRVLRPVYKYWMILAEKMGAVVWFVFMCLTYYLVFTPVALFLRLRGIDYMRRSFERSQPSYWEERKSIPFDKDNYRKQS